MELLTWAGKIIYGDCTNDEQAYGAIDIFDGIYPLCFFTQKENSCRSYSGLIDYFRRGRYLKRGGKMGIRIFPDKPITKKGNETPMGGGKGSPDHYVAVIKPGTVMFEMGGVPEETAKELEYSTHQQI